jgi:DNA-binding NarL/FixJ family response regulator
MSTVSYFAAGAQRSGKREIRKTLSAHEAGRFSPCRPKRLVRYDPDEPGQVTPRLTLREEEVLSLVAQGKSNLEISTLAGIAVATVEKHIENIYSKLGVNSRAEAAIWFLTRKIEALQRENAELKRQLTRLGRTSAVSSA